MRFKLELTLGCMVIIKRSRVYNVIKRGENKGEKWAYWFKRMMYKCGNRGQRM